MDGWMDLYLAKVCRATREAKAYITGATRTVTMQMQYCYKGNFTKETSYTLYSKEMYEKHHYSQIEVYNIITQIHTI
jgi:hypothetical protein